MKKRLIQIFSLLLSLVIFSTCLSMLVLPAVAAVTEDDVSFEIENGGATVTGCVRYTAEMVIPDTLGGYPVKKIGDYAFSSFPSLIALTIPDTVEEIGESAFAFCEKLEEVKLPANLKIIGEAAFLECTSLKPLVIPEGCLTINAHAFQKCFALKSIQLPAGLTTIKPRTFYGCITLESITIPSGVTKIGRGALSRCLALTHVTIPDGVTRLEDELFAMCTGLESVTIPDSVTSIGYGVFSDCDALVNVELPEGLKKIGGCAFSHCTALHTLDIPSGVTTIENGAFQESGLQSITIPEGITTLEGSLFSDCDFLRSVTLPSTLKTIKGYVLYSCDALNSIVIPDGTETIEDHAFDYSPFDSITLPSSIKKIGYSYFGHNQTHVYYKGTPSMRKKIDNQSASVMAGMIWHYIPKAADAFTDIKKKDWFFNAVDYVYDAKLFSGTSENTFGPKEKMTRAMFVTVLGRLHGQKVNNNVTTRFSDVKKGKYYTGYVKWGADNGIVAGISATTFGPNANITREQICTLMVRYCDYADITLQQVNAPIIFNDAGDASSYAKAAIKACQQGGLVKGEKIAGGYNFRPKGNATRAEVATIIMNFAKAYK